MNAGELLAAVGENYDRYLDDRSNSEALRIGGESPDEPHREAVRGEAEPFLNVATEADEENLLCFSEELPEVHEAPYRFLLAYPVELTRLMRVRPLTVDHQYYWAWSAQALSDIQSGSDAVIRSKLANSIQWFIHLLLARPSPMDQSKLKRISEIARTKHQHRTNENSYELAAFCSYPILEGFLKDICSDVIEPNGVIREGEQLHGIDRTYPDDYYRCNSVGDLLHHTEHHVIDTEAEAVMRGLKKEIAKFGDEGGYRMIDRWRNTLLHGQEIGDIQAGIIANLLCLLVWISIDKEQFDEQHSEIIDSIVSAQQRPGSVQSRTIYPPEINHD